MVMHIALCCGQLWTKHNASPAAMVAKRDEAHRTYCALYCPRRLIAFKGGTSTSDNRVSYSGRDREDYSDRLMG